MKIYIASSWKNSELCLSLADLFRAWLHEVDCFCDTSTGRYVFHFTEMVEDEKDLETLNAIRFLADHRSQKAFKEDKTWLDWAEAVVMVLPCGNSAHLEAGYKRGQGGKLFILGEFPAGEFDVMYGFADGLFTFGELDKLRLALS